MAEEIPNELEETKINNQEGVEYTTQEKPVKSPSVSGFISDLVKVIVVAVIIMLLFRYFVAEPFIVSGISMVPTYQNHQYLVINKAVYRFSQPQRGDVMVFKYPQNTKEFFIKRVIGLPGEKVKVADGHVVIYNNDHPEGKVLDEPYLPDQNVTFGDSKIVTLGSDEYFVLGDNRLASSDSRIWGILPKEDIVGKVLIRVFPPQSFGIISDPNYQF